MRRSRHVSQKLICLIIGALPVALAAVSASTSRADSLSSVRQLFLPPEQTPHPSVAHVFVRESDALASGSGTLIYVDGDYGYVLTNWHVVRSADPRQTLVKFPDGFQSAATVLKTDEKWDLALLRIWRPRVAPMSISTTVPAVGEELVIAGYGQGTYRAARGRCRHYAAPDAKSPQEMIEVSVAARQGDSGGPIINGRGELAAVLFGSGSGLTTGTHVGRIVSFLNSVSLEPPARQRATRVVNMEGRITHTSIANALSDVASDLHTPFDDSTASTKQAKYYQLPPLEWSPPTDDTTVAAARADKGAPIFPGEQTPQPAVAAQLTAPRSSSNFAQRTPHAGAVTAALVAVNAGKPTANPSLTAVDPRPRVALPLTSGHCARQQL